MFHRITVGLKGGILRVANVAGRLLLKLGGRAPGCGRACPALVGLLVVGSCWRDCLVVDCRRWPLALLCLSVSDFGEAGLWDSPSESGVCLHCVLCTSLCQCIGGGGCSQQNSLEDPRIIAFGGSGGGIGGGP